MADDALSRAKKARQLAPPKTGAVVPARQPGRDLIALARAAAARPSPAAPVIEAAPAAETNGAASTALVARVREAAARPVPVRKPPEPPAVETPATVLPAAAPATQVVPVQVTPGQTVPVEIPAQPAADAQPIVVNVNIVNENRGYWGPYWWPYWHGCGRHNCPRLVGQICHRWICG